MYNQISIQWFFVPISLIVVLAALVMSACSPLNAINTSFLPTPARTLVTSPAVGATETNVATSSPIVVVTETPILTATPTVTETKRAISVTSRPSATPTPTTPSGVFVSAIKIEPIRAKSDEPPQFIVNFINTTGRPQTYRWFVKVYFEDQPQSFGETSKIESNITPKISQVKAFSDWKTMTVLDCLFVIACVFWVDENNQVHEFLKTNATSPATGFYGCP